MEKSDISNPYFIHHSDHPGLVLVTKPLNGDNYSTWRIAMSISLNTKNKLGFVNGTIKAPSQETNPDDYVAWSRCNDMVHSWIVNSITPDISDSVIYYTTAREVWEDLRDRFSQSNAPRIFQIQREIAYLKQEQLSVAAYYTKLKGLWDELASYTDSICTCGVQQDHQKLMQFLMGLNESYAAARGQILLMNPLPSVRQAYSSICQDERQRSLGTTQVSNDTTSVAMAVRNGRQSSFPRSNQPNRRAGSSNRRPHYSHCNEDGHFVETCWKLIGYPPGHPKNKSKNHGGCENMASVNNVSEGTSKDNSKPIIAGLSDTQIQQLLTMLDIKGKGSDGQTPQVNATAAPGSGFEEDDWFG